MARKQPLPRRSKPVYYFIVEGCTEENYLKLLKKIYRKDAKLENCDGGSAKAVLEKAKKPGSQVGWATGLSLPTEINCQPINWWANKKTFAHPTWLKNILPLMLNVFNSHIS